MGEVVPIHSRRIFAYDEALRLLPIVKRITERAVSEVSEIKDRLRFVPHGEPLHTRMQARLELSLRRWSIKISQLGCEPRGMWLVDFDSGNGWFSWRYGDENLNFFHAHETQAGPEEPHDEKILT